MVVGIYDGIRTYLRLNFVQEWPFSWYPPWAHGPGYVISRDIAKFIVGGHRERELMVQYLSNP